MSNLRKVIDDSLAMILSAAILAFGTMTYQFAQMRVEVDRLKTDVSKIESNISAMMSRQTYYYGEGEADEVARIARAINKSKNPGLELLPSAEAQEK